MFLVDIFLQLFTALRKEYSLGSAIQGEEGSLQDIKKEVGRRYKQTSILLSSD